MFSGGIKREGPYWRKGESDGDCWIIAEAYSDLSRTSKMERFVKIVNGWMLLLIFSKNTPS